MRILILCSWRALRVQKSPNTDETPTTSQEVVSSPAPSVPVSDTSWLEGFDDDENGEEMDVEELRKALTEAATSASQSKKPQSKHHSMSNVKPTVSPRPSMMDSSTPGMVITWIKTLNMHFPFCILLPDFHIL